jgi:predicted lipoprotein with Yx(FWY)xxD motif
MKMRILAGLAAVGALAMMGAAFAAPPGVTDKNGAWVAPDGKPLYTFAKDTAGAAATGVSAAWPLAMK